MKHEEAGTIRHWTHRENVFFAIIREYLAITLQEVGLRTVARFVRARRRRRTAATLSHDESPSPLADIQCAGEGVQPSDGNAAGAMIPRVVDTDSERQLQFSEDALQSRMRLDDPYALIAPYTRQMMSFLLFNPDPAHILLIGLGGGSLAKFCYRHLPHTRITVIEIDERVIALRDSFYIPADDHRFRVIHDDGARYMATLDRPVDAILIDAFDEAGVSPSLATSNFFRDASRHLTPDGVLIMNLHGNPDRFTAHLERVRAVFGNRALLAPVTANDNVLLCAFAQDVPPPAAKQLFLRARYLQSKLPLHFRSYLQRMRDGRVL